MRKLGLGKKGDGPDDDSNRSRLFSRSKNKSPNPAVDNPYANVPQMRPNPYAQAKINAGVAAGEYGRGPSPSAPQQQQGREKSYGNEKDSNRFATSGGYGASTGYGDDRYGSAQPAENPRARPGGYGGLGQPQSFDNAELDDGRSALFGGAPERLQNRQAAEQPPPYDHGQPNGTGQDYEPYGDRQLTAEEEEEEDVTATKQQIRFLKREDVSSTRNALQAAAQAEETGTNTLARLGAQGERVFNTEKNLDLTANHNRSAEDKAKELKQLNKSMFAVHIANPLTAKSRKEQRDADVLERHQAERQQREQTRREGFASEQRLQKNFATLNKVGTGEKAKGSSLAERAKYQFEADSEDEELENEIDSNLNALHGAATRLNALSKAQGQELEEQNRHLDRINDKSIKVDDQIAMNRARLDRFK